MASGVATMVVNTAALAVGYPIYLHFLGYEQYGVWLVLSTVLSLASLGNLGVSQAVMKLVAEEHGRNDVDAVHQYIMSAIGILAISGTAVLGLIILLRTWIVSLFGLSQGNADVALRLLPYIGGLSVYVLIGQSLNAALSGLGRMDLANYIQAIGKVVSVGLSAVLLWWGFKAESLVVGSVAAYLFIHVASSFFIRRILHVPRCLSFRMSRSRMKRLIMFGSGVLGGGVANVFLGAFNKLMLSRFAGVSTVPVYDIAFNGTVQVKTLVESALRPFMPEISRLSGCGTLASLRRIRALNFAALRLVAAVGLPLHVLLFVSAAALLHVWLGDRCTPAVIPAFRLMLIVTFLMLTATPAYHTLLGMGFSGAAFVSSVIIAGGNCILVLVAMLLGKNPSVHSIFIGLIVVSLLSAAYLIGKTAKETRIRWRAFHELPDEQVSLNLEREVSHG